MNNLFGFDRNILQPQLDLDTSKDKSGQSTQITGFIETVDSNGNRIINEVKDGEIFTDEATRLVSENIAVDYETCTGSCDCYYSPKTNKWTCTPAPGFPCGKGCECFDLSRDPTFFLIPTDLRQSYPVKCVTKQNQPVEPPQPTPECEGTCKYTWSVDAANPNGGYWTVSQLFSCGTGCQCPNLISDQPNGFLDGEYYIEYCEKITYGATPTPTPTATATKPFACGECLCTFVGTIATSFSVATPSGFWTCDSIASNPCTIGCQCGAAPSISPATKPGDTITIACMPQATPQWTALPTKTPDPTQQPIATPLPTMNGICKGKCYYKWSDEKKSYISVNRLGDPITGSQYCKKSDPRYQYECTCKNELAIPKVENQTYMITECGQEYQTVGCQGYCNYYCSTLDCLAGRNPSLVSNTCLPTYYSTCPTCPPLLLSQTCSLYNLPESFWNVPCDKFRKRPQTGDCGSCTFKMYDFADGPKWSLWKQNCTKNELENKDCVCVTPLQDTYPVGTLYSTRCKVPEPNIKNPYSGCNYVAVKYGTQLKWLLINYTCPKTTNFGCAEPNFSPTFENQTAVTYCLGIN